MHKDNPVDLISIITPSYNSAKFIAQTIDSVLAQTYQNWEMLIVDDCSADNSVEIIKSYIAKDTRVKLIELKNNTGAAVARNKAIEQAKGRYIAFLDADDLWMPEKLKKQIDFMDGHNLAFTYSSFMVINEDGKILSEFTTKKVLTYNSLLKTNSIGCLTAIYDTKILGRVYMPLIRKRQDYGLWLKIIKKTGTMEAILEPLAKYRIVKNSLSRNKFKAAQYQWKTYRDIEKLSFIKSLYYFVHYAYFGFFKYRK